MFISAIQIQPHKKLLFTIAVLITSLFSAIAQDVNVNYDSTLAKHLEADDYGMKSYVLVILKTGENNIPDEAKRDSLFAGHLNNIKRLAKEKKLIVAGPLSKNEKSYRGIFILDLPSFEEAKELLQTDPAISEKVLAAELFHWYGSAALPAYLETHKKIEKYQF
ncbi:MAG: YciI family protein [Salibacteraceae bacterium]